MPPIAPVLLAIASLLVVAAGLFRQVLEVRAVRQELDSYLRWLLEDAAGPVAPPSPGRYTVHERDRLRSAGCPRP